MGSVQESTTRFSLYRRPTPANRHSRSGCNKLQAKSSGYAKCLLRTLALAVVLAGPVWIVRLSIFARNTWIYVRTVVVVVAIVRCLIGEPHFPRPYETNA